MNKALIERLLSLLPQEYRDLYQNTLIDNPNSRFGDTFNYVYREYGIHGDGNRTEQQSNESATEPYRRV